MSQTQLSLPALSNEESTVVERFIERSRDFVPSVEVTLAKRILRPGSNRVLCLAARTRVPINDDEVASISDLALKLSDGTNVALSLSFFNDTVSGDCIPFARYSYDPNRYSVRSESKLGMVLIATCLAALTGIYSFTHSPFGRNMQAKPILKASHPGASLLKTNVIKPSMSSPKSAVMAPATGVPRAASSSIPKFVPKSVPGVGSRPRVKRSIRKSDREHFSPEEILVPPPPAAYIAPYGLPAQFFNQIPGLTNLPKTAKPLSKAFPKAAMPIPEAEQVSRVSSDPKRTPARSSTVDQSIKTKADSFTESRPQAIQKSEGKNPNKSNVVEQRIEEAQNYDQPFHQSAPVPGNSAMVPPFERIVLPNQ